MVILSNPNLTFFVYEYELFIKDFWVYLDNMNKTTYS